MLQMHCLGGHIEWKPKIPTDSKDVCSVQVQYFVALGVQVPCTEIYNYQLAYPWMNLCSRHLLTKNLGLMLKLICATLWLWHDQQVVQSGWRPEVPGDWEDLQLCEKHTYSSWYRRSKIGCRMFSVLHKQRWCTVPQIWTQTEKKWKFKLQDIIHPVVMPNTRRHALLGQYHDSLTGGHQAFKRTYEPIRFEYFWPGMYVDVDDYTKRCDASQKAKHTN